MGQSFFGTCWWIPEDTALNAKLIFGVESRVFITAHWHSNFSRLPAVSVVFKICFGRVEGGVPMT